MYNSGGNQLNTHREVYIGIGKRLETLIEESFEKKENIDAFSRIASFHDDYERWIDIINSNKNEVIIYKEALSNYKMMLLFIWMCDDFIHFIDMLIGNNYNYEKF